MIRTAFVLACVTATQAASAQSAAPPSFGPDAPWAQSYAKCTNDATERLAATAAAEPRPWPEQLVTQAQRECGGQVPDDSLGVRATVALVRSEVLHRFGPGRSLTLAPRPPLALPEMFPMGDGIACPHPDYPPQALRAQATGISGVEITVDPQGQLVDGRVVQPSGTWREHKFLDRAALESFALCKVPPSAAAGNRAIRMNFEWKII